MSKSQGDFRPVEPSTTVGDHPASPRRDAGEPGAVYWFGKRIWLGHAREDRGFHLEGKEPSRVGKLFWLLAKPIGLWHPTTEIQREVEGFTTDASLGATAKEVKNAGDRISADVKRLNAELRDKDLDDHVVILPRITKDRGRGYVMLDIFRRIDYGVCPVADCPLATRKCA